MELLDEETQRRLKLRTLFLSSGWAVFEKELADLKDAQDSAVQEVLLRPVLDLASFNHKLGKAEGINAVIATIDSLKEEISPAEGVNSDDVKE